MPSFTSTPARISAPAATICAAGTASPSAQGQVMISTAAAISKAWCQPAPSRSQVMKAVAASV